MNPASIGNIVYNDVALAPCTAAAAVELIHATGLTVEGLEVVIIGHSEIVGKPTGSDFGFKFIRHHINEYKAMTITGSQDVERAYSLIAKSSRFKEVLAEVPNRYPTQLYEAVGYFLTFGILWYVYSTSLCNWSVC